MSKKKTYLRQWAEILRPTNADESAFWWSLILPLGSLVMVLKLWRLVERSEVAVWWAAPDLIRSDILVVSSFAAVGWASLRALRSQRLARTVVLAIIQIAVVVWTTLEVVANHFFSVTGSTFDLHLLFFSLGRLDETFSIVSSEVSVSAWALLGLVVTILLILPWGLRSWVDQRSGQIKQVPEITEDTNSRSTKIAVAVALGCAVFAILPPAGEDYSAFGRSNIINLLMSVQDVRFTGQFEATLDRRPLDDLRLLTTDSVDDDPKNVVIIILESTRAQSMTVYNPELKTTPFLADLAEQSTVADRAYTVVPHTSKALVATLCGLEPRLRMPITEAMPDGLPGRCLAALLGDEGYSSVFLQSATEAFEDRPELLQNMGYDDFIPLERMDSTGFEAANYFGREDMIMLPDSKRWLEDNKDEPFFATYLTLTPHHDYRAPRRFGRLDFVEDDELNRYKNTIYYVDQFTRELMEQYRELGLYENTLFVIIGDHGEGFEEHGRSQHDNVIWEEGLHVPLMIYDPSRPEGKRLDYPVSQIDLAPTILDWLGYDVEGGEYPGMPIWESDEDRRVYAHCWYERRCMASIGMRFKYIDHFGRRGAEVYDIIEDPREQNNLADVKKDKIRTWRAEVYGWRESVNALYRREQSDFVEEYIYTELPQSAVDKNFEIGDLVRYRGYEIDVDELQPGSRGKVTHYFEAKSRIPGGWQLFVHGQRNGQMLNLDHIPVGGLLPLDEWEPGQIIADEHSFRIPRDWSPGTFTLYLGIYHRDQGRASISGDVEVDDEDRAAVFELPIR